MAYKIRTKKNNRGQEEGSFNLFPPKDPGQGYVVGGATIELKGRVFKVVVFKKDAETRKGNPTVGFVKLIDLGAPGAQNQNTF